MLLRFNYSSKIKIICSGCFVFALSLTVLFSGCKKDSVNNKVNSGTAEKQGQIIQTWDYLGEAIPPIIYSPELEALPPEGSLVWAGTVSHHLLADKLIDNWFSEIAKRRTVENFFIICPSHFGLSVQEWSLDDCCWQTANGMVYTNTEIEQAIANTLGVEYDPQVFPFEHGVNALVPYISRYFPNAKICVIALFGEPPLNQRSAQKVAEALEPYFSDSGKKKNFLLISTDFAHHGDYEGTAFKDSRSREFFNAPSESTWVFCGCDNRPGIYALSRFLTPDTKNAVLYHTNSFELSGQDGNDITSYFFSLFYD